MRYATIRLPMLMYLRKRDIIAANDCRLRLLMSFVNEIY